jgi:hypothetical protein
MLFGQRFGATEATWEKYRPVYRLGWERAAQVRLGRGSWSQTEADLRRGWDSKGTDVAWEDAREVVRDVWHDVVKDANRGAEVSEQLRVEEPSE